MLEWIRSSKFPSHKARLSDKFISRKYSQPTKSERGTWILAKVKFKELCNSKLSALHTLS